MPTAAKRASASGRVPEVTTATRSPFNAPKRSRRPGNSAQTLYVLRLSPLDLIRLGDGVEIRTQSTNDIRRPDAVHRGAQVALVNLVLRCPVQPHPLRGLTRLHEHAIQIEQDGGDAAH